MSYKCQLSSIITRGRQSSTFKPAPTLREVCNAFHSERTPFKRCFVDHFNFKCAIGQVVFLGNFIGLLFTSCIFDLVIIIEHRFSFFLNFFLVFLSLVFQEILLHIQMFSMGSKRVVLGMWNNLEKNRVNVKTRVKFIEIQLKEVNNES